jgi:hypothetical protein
LAAFGAVFWLDDWGTRCARCITGWRLTARVFTQSSDGFEQLEAVPECRDAKLLQVLFRQARKNCLVNLIIAECRLVLSETEAPQPDHNVHDGAYNAGRRTSSVGEARLSRVLWRAQGFAKLAEV